MTELITQCLTLNRGKRKELIKVLTESLERPAEKGEERFNLLFKIVTEMFGNGILSGCKQYNLVLGRRFIAYQMHNEGYTWSEIGRLLKKAHASVMHMYKMMDEVFDYPEIFFLEISQWNQFTKLLKQKENEKGNGEFSSSL